MSYLVLARKWRPKDFSETVGQEHVLQALTNALDSQRLHHAYLFAGTRGVGKTTIVRSILHALQAKRMRVLLCAPTGRAAKRLTESTGVEAKTIHRLLAFDPKAYGFTHGQTNPLAANLVVWLKSRWWMWS